ncbi:hypothetical protein RB620_01880 [Paenibacillus sp. LHD-117]|uniref:hypothetical protein n=1 Tax=Paenibacillus sp. LHD-117 TaxID=3071412 RepID=UPI0027DEABB8|nr:hypothetical protein [Paenibacillus sp. LHD-117]MDQ6418176.1 hypothetical protein [Paenibacillus sp. LHD-117]
MPISLTRLFSLVAALCLLFGAAAAQPAAARSARAPEAGEKVSNAPSENGLKPVQVFDVAQGKVVKAVPNDKQFQKMAKSWLKSVSGLSPQLTNDNSCTFVYRVPLAKPATIKVDSITVTTQDLFIFYCQDNPPLLLVFDGDRKPYLLLFKEDLKPFIKKVGVPALAE